MMHQKKTYISLLTPLFNALRSISSSDLDFDGEHAAILKAYNISFKQL
jgi:hypothetical protein